MNSSACKFANENDNQNDQISEIRLFVA